MGGGLRFVRGGTIKICNLCFFNWNIFNNINMSCTSTRALQKMCATVIWNVDVGADQTHAYLKFYFSARRTKIQILILCDTKSFILYWKRIVSRQFRLSLPFPTLLANAFDVAECEKKTFVISATIQNSFRLNLT